MGCGASKSARVLEEEINILDHPARRSGGHETENGVLRAEREGEGEEEGRGETEREGGLDTVYSHQSEIERAIKETTSPSSSVAAPSHNGPPPTTTQSVPHSTSDPVVLEFCMSPDNRLEPRAPIPARLKKLNSAPVVTKEMLEMKQHEVAERKKEEMEKKLERSRMSRKDRLRKEIMAAREFNPSESEKEVVLTESFSYSRLQEGGGREGGGRGGLEGKGEARREERGGYDTSAGMEGDKNYNTEQAGEFWEEPSSSQMEDTRPDTQTSACLENSTSNLEQFM